MDFRNCLGMIWSVSTLARSSGQTRPVCWVKAFMAGPLGNVQFAYIDEVAGNRGRGSHRLADQVSTPTGPLAAFEIAVGGGGAVLATTQLVRVHGQAHRAARLAPFKTGLDKDPVQAFGFGLGLDQ